MRPRRRVMMGKKTVLMVDPPKGSEYGFPQPAPQNWGFWETEEKKRWLVKAGYPSEELTGKFSIALIHVEVEDNYLEGRANLL